MTDDPLPDSAPDPEPALTIDITVDARGFVDGVRDAQAAIMFGFHPDLQEDGERHGPAGGA